jgi:hypothetical protein
MANGDHARLDDSVIASLRSRVRGSVLLPEDSAYDSARTIWNGIINRRPAIIVRCTGTADVVEAVKTAREHNLLVSIRGGGHNIAGLAVAEGGLMMDLSQMKGVFVDPTGKRAVVQGGCTLGNVDRETQLHGLATPLGFISATGVGGLTLGGGFGYLTRRFGWAPDNLISAEIVTVSGEVVRASEHENPDLFWALRGGGGNFGVVTSLEFRLHQVGPRIMGGIILHPIEEAERLLKFFKEYTRKASRELTSVFICRPAPAAPFVPKDWHGKPVAGLVLCHSGTLDQARRDLAPIKNWGKPIADVVMEKTYCEQQTMLDATQPNGRHYYWKSVWVSRIPDNLIDEIVENTRRFPSPFSMILLFQVDGAIGEISEDSIAVGNRDAAYNLNINAGWDDGPDEPKIAWARNAWKAVRRFSTGGVYANFLTEDEMQDRLREAYRGNIGRLASVKGKWDPANFFQMNHNVRPAP